MTVSVAMLDKSYERIAKKLNALDLDIAVRTFNTDGQFMIDGSPVSPRDLEIDYLWLSPHIPQDKLQKMAFDLATECRSVDVLQTYNAGLDHPFYKTMAKKGTRICNSSAQAVAISEYVMAQVLSIVHPIALQDEQQATKTWKVTPFRELSRMTWLIVGYGPIGYEISKRAKAFGTQISVVRRSPAPSELIDQAGTLDDARAFAANADVIVLACSLNDQTRGFADEKFFQSIKEGATLVNIARGALVDEQAMISALNEGRLGKAILDVFQEEPLPTDNPLWSHPKVRVTSHTSFAGNGGGARWTQLFLDNIARYARGEPLGQEVNPADI